MLRQYHLQQSLYAHFARTDIKAGSSADDADLVFNDGIGVKAPYFVRSFTLGTNTSRWSA